MGESYVFFDWERSEKIKSKGILHTDLSDLTSKAKYISFGQRPMRLPLIVSSKGYGIAPASARTALVCNIKLMDNIFMLMAIHKVIITLYMAQERAE